MPVKIKARHMMMDLYNCKTSFLDDKTKTEEVISGILQKFRINCRSFQSAYLSEDHFAVSCLFADGHLTVQVYRDIKYAATDIFMAAETPEPEKILRQIRELFKPEKTKSTFLKRGDFGSDKNIKPKVNTQVAPLRRIKSAGAKMIRILSRRNGK